MSPPETPPWAPSASLETLKHRAALLADIRQFFADRNILEVETPLFSAAGNSDPGIAQIELHSSPSRWVRSSPEYAMKRLLAAGSGDIYELGRVARRGESGRNHNPEFTLLEWYRTGWDYRELMSECAELVEVCGRRFNRTWDVESISYSALFERHLDVNPLESSSSELEQVAVQRGQEPAPGTEMSRDDWLDLLISQGIQPQLDTNTITLVHGYPASQAALAQLDDQDPRTARRFELFLGTTELANGYQELTDADEQRRRFESENNLRQQRGDATAPLDENLLSALRHGLQPCSGVALGVDRLLMQLLDLDQISRVMAFDWERA